MGIKCLKNLVTFFCKLNLIGPCSELLNEALCILVAQGATKLPEVEAGDTQKVIWDLNPYCMHLYSTSFESYQIWLRHIWWERAQVLRRVPFDLKDTYKSAKQC